MKDETDRKTECHVQDHQFGIHFLICSQCSAHPVHVWVLLRDPGSPAGPTLKRAIPIVALGTGRDACVLALALTDELKDHLDLLSEAQRLDFNGFRILIRTLI